MTGPRYHPFDTMIELNLMSILYDLWQPAAAGRSPVPAAVRIVTGTDLQSIDMRRQWPI